MGASFFFYRQTDRQRDRQTDRQTDRKRERKRERDLQEMDTRRIGRIGICEDKE